MYAALVQGNDAQIGFCFAAARLAWIRYKVQGGVDQPMMVLSPSPASPAVPRCYICGVAYAPTLLRGRRPVHATSIDDGIRRSYGRRKSPKAVWPMCKGEPHIQSKDPQMQLEQDPHR